MPAVAALLTIEAALDRVLERVRPLPAERVRLEAAVGRVVREPVRALVDLPPFPSSAMDGFALRAQDTPGTLPVSARIAAGRPAPGPLSAREAMAIATGGVVPEGADAVVPLEYVVERDNKVEVGDAVAPGANIRVRGGDVRAGDLLLEPGTRLRPAQVGALAAAGVTEVACSTLPRAAVLVTGTELRPPGDALEPGQIYDSNSVLLAAQLASAGAVVERLETVADDEAAHRAALEHGLASDVLVTSGGVSVGPHDLVRLVAAQLGVEEVFWRVAVKPGKPVSFGVRERSLVFGLPGNPVSSLVGFELFVRPAVLALQGHADPRPPFEVGTLERAVRRNPQREELLRARLRHADTGAVLQPLSGQDSHMIARAATADALVLVPRGEGELAPEAPVRFLRLP